MFTFLTFDEYETEYETSNLRQQITTVGKYGHLA